MAAANVTGQTAAKAEPPAYAGSEACGTCHEDTANAFARNPHHAVEAEAKRGIRHGKQPAGLIVGDLRSRRSKNPFLSG